MSGAQFNARLSTDLTIENFSGHRVGGKHQRLPAPQCSSAFRHIAGLRLLTRNGHDWADHYPLIAEAAGALQVRSFLLDGEGGLRRGWHAGVRSAALLPPRKR